MLPNVAYITKSSVLGQKNIDRHYNETDLADDVSTIQISVLNLISNTT